MLKTEVESTCRASSLGEEHVIDRKDNVRDQPVVLQKRKSNTSEIGRGSVAMRTFCVLQWYHGRMLQSSHITP